MSRSPLSYWTRGLRWPRGRLREPYPLQQRRRLPPQLYAGAAPPTGLPGPWRFEAAEAWSAGAEAAEAWSAGAEAAEAFSAGAEAADST